jgi:hypothetical protein
MALVPINIKPSGSTITKTKNTQHGDSQVNHVWEHKWGQ